ncbi:hypothetical protein PMIN01_10620 [Paraphaeosphaeria minitans]|uniref:Uncharacterized protein n=1 Tax=Paraphaeosphaeria minitans TaxID=565426 RepID=A0A9P6KLJ5_9PLEO|nr:hypothetical protein PMIN01_10620 [Paraphaeosphaeria minitans]
MRRRCQAPPMPLEIRSARTAYHAHEANHCLLDIEGPSSGEARSLSMMGKFPRQLTVPTLPPDSPKADTKRSRDRASAIPPIQKCYLTRPSGRWGAAG